MDKNGKSNAERLIAQAVNLTGLIEYQPASVVSRTIIDKKAGTVTLFAFDGGQGLSEHTVPYDALIYVLDGEVDSHIGQASSNEERRVDHYAR